MRRIQKTLIEDCANKANVTILSITEEGKHIKVRIEKNKKGLVIVSKSASDYRVAKNIITDMRKVSK